MKREEISTNLPSRIICPLPTLLIHDNGSVAERREETRVVRYAFLFVYGVLISLYVEEILNLNLCSFKSLHEQPIDYYLHSRIVRVLPWRGCDEDWRKQSTEKGGKATRKIKELFADKCSSIEKNARKIMGKLSPKWLFHLNNMIPLKGYTFTPIPLPLFSYSFNRVRKGRWWAS